MSTNRGVRFAVRLVFAAAVMMGGVAMSNGASAAQPPAAQEIVPLMRPVRDEIRIPWSRNHLRQWLVCGPFWVEPKPGERPPEPGQGPDVDYLASVGGEAAARSAAGQTVKRDDGSIATWLPCASEDNVFDFLVAFPERKGQYNVTAYAYATIRRTEACKAVFALGTYNKTKVYLNGALVHSKAKLGGGLTEPLTVTVELQKGDNAILIKMESLTWFWGFTFSVTDEKEVAALPTRTVQAVIEPPGPGQEGALAVSTVPAPTPAVPNLDTGQGMITPGLGALRFQVLDWQGKLMGDARAERLEKARFDVSRWPEGPYEIRLSSQRPDDTWVYTHLPWYKGDWEKGIQALLDDCDKLPADARDPSMLCRKMFGRLVLNRMKGDPRADKTLAAALDPKGQQELLRVLMEYRELQADEAVRIRPHGFYRLAWRDEIDDSPQFARVYLPPDYDRNRQWPLVVHLHGWRENPDYIAYAVTRHHGIAESHNVIYLEPHGRGNTSYRGMGEADVLRAVRLAAEKLNVDEERVYLKGESMGGSGTWRVGTHHPEIFAALAPAFGGEDYHVSMDEQRASRLTLRERFRFEARSAFAQVESLFSTPVFINHGDLDIVMPTDASRYAVRMLQRWGYDVRYWEHPGKAHESLGETDEVVRWFLTHRLNRNPRRVRIRAAELKSASAHWVRVEQREDPFAFIIADVEVLDPRTIRLETQNALQVRLLPGAELIDRGNPVRVIWNGKDEGAYSFAGGSVVLHAKGYTPAPLAKNPELEGPIADVFNKPFAIVEGTVAADAAMREQCRRLADETVRFWKTSQLAAPRYFKDTEIGEGQMAQYSLILIGGPEANAVTKKVQDRLPLQVAPDGITLTGRIFAGTDLAISMIYPSPLNANRYVQVMAATSAEGMSKLRNTARDVPRDLDFYITSGGRTPVAAGFLDNAWQFREQFIDRTERASER